MEIHQHRRKVETFSGIMAILAYPLWWIFAKEFCISQPPIFAILLCAGYGVLGMLSKNKIVFVAGVLNLGYSVEFLLNWIYKDLYHTKYHIMTIAISSAICLLIFIFKPWLCRLKP